MENPINIELGEVIAERQFSYIEANKEHILTIKIGKPRTDSKPNGDWECPIEINGKVKLAYGIDSYQALMLAQQLITADLKYLMAQKKNPLKWLGMDDLGLTFH